MHEELFSAEKPIKAMPTPPPVPRGKIKKGLTEQNVVEYLRREGKGWTLVGINWKKRKVHLVNGFHVKKVVSLPV